VGDAVLDLRGRFAPDELSAARARRFVRDALDGVVTAGVQADVVLVASELATNAVLHAETPFEVSVVLDGHLRVEVSDDDPTLPRPRLVTTDDIAGRGLHIVSELARRWGATPTGTGKTVWAEFDL
jgi:anti-sigma regulatory factor (Ser/Thr protein kinase)